MKTFSSIRFSFLFLFVLVSGLTTTNSLHAQEILFSLDITEEPVGAGDEVLVRIFDSAQMGGFTYLYPDTVADYASQVLFAPSMIGENIVFSFGIYRPGEGKVYWEESNQRSTVVPDSGMVTTLPGYVLGELDPGHTVSTNAAASNPTSQNGKTTTSKEPQDGGASITPSLSLGGPFATGTYLPMPDLLSPANPAFEVPIDPVLDWQFGGTSGNYQFDYQIGNDLPGNVAKSAPVVVVTNTEADLKTTPLLEEEKYYWRVRACDVGTQLLCSPWTEMWQFTTVFDLQEDGNIELLSPQDGEELGTTTPIFTWDLSGNYQNQGDIFFYVCDASTSSSACLASEAFFTVNPETVGSNDRESMALPVTGLDSLSDHSSYYWRIERDKNGVIDPGSVGYFSIETAGPGIPEVPGLAYPSANEALISLTPVLSWGSVENAAYYEYQHGLYTEALTESSPAPINVGSNVNTSDPGNAPTSLDYSTSYRWRVRACNLGVCSAWSTQRVFTTLYPPVSITYPVYGAGAQATTLEVGWTYDSNLGGPYEEFAVEWSTGKLSSPEGRIEYIPGSQLHAVLSQLPASSEVNWHVQGKGAGVWQAFSNDASFLTGAGHGPISLLTPDGSVEIEPSYPAPPTFDWDDGTGGYQQFEIRVGLAYSDPGYWQTFSVYNPLTTSLTWTPLSYETTYGWQVRGMVTGIWEEWTPAGLFTTVDDPGTATTIVLSSPRNGVTVYTDAPDYAWSLDQSYDELELFVCDASPCDATTTSVLSETGLPGTLTSFVHPLALPLLDTQSYYWTVRGKLGSAWTQSTTSYFTVDADGDGGPTGAPPVATSITYPFEYDAASPIEYDTNIAINWQPVEDATSYRYQLQTDTNWTGTETSTASDWFRPSDLVGASDYYVRAKACNNGGCSPWSEVRHFKTRTYTETPPGIPTPIAPALSATGIVVSPMLQWQAGVGTEPGSYHYQITTASSFANAALFTSESSFAASFADQYTTTYFWRVRACNDDGVNCGAWSSGESTSGAWAFTTQTAPVVLAPPVPSLVSPPNGQIDMHLNPDLMWASNGAAEYRYQALYEPIGTSLNPPDEIATTNSSVPSGATAPGTEVHWRVKACNGEVCSDWTDEWQFSTVSLDEGYITLNYPTQGQMNVGTAFTFEWYRDVTDHPFIRLQYGTSQTFEPGSFVELNNLGEEVAVSGLAADTPYYWKVGGSVSANGPWTWSDLGHFNTGTGNPGSGTSYPRPNLPGNNAPNTTTDVTFVWDLAANGGSHNFTRLKLEWTTNEWSWLNQHVVYQDDPNITTSWTTSASNPNLPEHLKLQNNTTYYWRVTGKTASGWEDPSNHYTFHTGSAPSGQTYSASGVITEGGLPKENIEVLFDPDDGGLRYRPLSNGSGVFEVPNLPAGWEGEVTIASSGYDSNPTVYILDNFTASRTDLNFALTSTGGGGGGEEYPRPYDPANYASHTGTRPMFTWEVGPNAWQNTRIEIFAEDVPANQSYYYISTKGGNSASHGYHQLPGEGCYTWQVSGRINGSWGDPSSPFQFCTGVGNTPTIVVSGTVTDDVSSSAIVGATVLFPGNPNVTAVSGGSGAYSAVLPLGWSGTTMVSHDDYEMGSKVYPDPLVEDEPNEDYALTAKPPGEVPSKPVLASPADGSLNVSNPVTFDWSDVTGTSYDIRIGTSITEAGDVINIVFENESGRLTESGIPDVSLPAATFLYWQVRACRTDNSACSGWTSSFNFTTIGNDLTRYYYLKDHLGSVRVVVNELGAPTDYSDYYPFGLAMPGRTMAGGTKSMENYTGHELDAGTGLHYANARFYDGVLGRWGARDPMEDTYPGLSTYSYVGNNPITSVDPTGELIKVCSGEKDKNGDVVSEECYTYRKGESYSGENKFINDIVNALNELSADDFADFAVDRFDDDNDPNLKIIPWKTSSATADEIKFNNKEKVGTGEYKRLWAKNLDAILLHELVHAYVFSFTDQKEKGEYDFTKLQMSAAGKIVPHGSGIQVEEWSPLYIENVYRFKKGYNLHDSQGGINLSYIRNPNRIGRGGIAIPHIPISPLVPPKIRN